jgi:hypothetical protein
MIDAKYCNFSTNGVRRQKLTSQVDEIFQSMGLKCDLHLEHLAAEFSVDIG